MFALNGKKALLTGASGDLGSAMARALYEAGADIAILDASPNTSEVGKKFSGFGTAVGYCVDLTARDQTEKVFEKAVETLGGLDILVNCAGINLRSPAEEFPENKWDRIIDVNLKATFLMCQLAGQHMIRQKSGKIINIASMTSFTGGFNTAAYAASKGAVAQLTKTLSNEWAKYGICVNAIAPGYMWTQMNADYYTNGPGRDVRTGLTARIPKERWGKPEDLQGPAVFLASEASDYVSGVILPVDGGFLAR